MSIGLGYKGACQLRIDEGYTTQQQNGQGYEEPGHERYCLYFGRSHIQDHETDVSARGLLKVGRAKYLSALNWNCLLIESFCSFSPLIDLPVIKVFPK